ncbi:MAG: TonB family protein [Candidatus Baltobacteraceae bacterium]
MPNADKSPFITSGHRFRNFLGWAFLISLAVHFVAAPFLKNLTQHSEEQQVEKVSVTKRIIVKPPTPPPPTPTPPPPKTTPPPKQQQQQPQPQLKVQPPKTQSNNASTTSTESKYVAPKSGSENGAPAGHGTAPPAPVASVGPPASTPTPKPACKTPYQEATATQTVAPEYPDSAREQGLGRVEVAVVVTVGASGSPSSPTIQTSSGNMAMDQAAKQAAMQSQYVPKIVNCTPVAESYIFRVTFDPNQ